MTQKICFFTLIYFDNLAKTSHTFILGNTSNDTFLVYLNKINNKQFLSK